MTDQKHSPLPWKIYPSDLDGCDGIYDADGDAVFVFERDSQDAINAPLIVRAVNSLPGLIKAAELAKEVLYDDYDECHEEIKQIDQALAAAGVKP